MKRPGNNRNRPAQREPAGAEQAHGAAQRMTRLHRGRQYRTALLEQERDVRSERRAQRQRQTSGHCHSFSTTRSPSCRPLCESGNRDAGARLRALVGQRESGVRRFACTERRQHLSQGRTTTVGATKLRVQETERAMLLVRPVSPALLASGAVLRSEGQRGGWPWPPQQRGSTL